eukprot:CAMPEP_0181320666 /NCGR_PEP_ID=MMETSP1101-20121128/18250_1 /TAXON_ID=46948 /ORGANISM="Rhodomonas abbreviata, Strain Caron Lab Isolate" /LENGTH=113 /DNA_ID=CAMNT_0023428395 /DNA_START=246 /DNA_END=587 /DNA_ORIENTATION=+
MPVPGPPLAEHELEVTVKLPDLRLPLAASEGIARCEYAELERDSLSPVTVNPGPAEGGLWGPWGNLCPERLSEGGGLERGLVNKLLCGVEAKRECSATAGAGGGGLGAREEDG